MRVEEIEEPLMQEIRYLDKLIDELAKGKSMDKILRSGQEHSVKEKPKTIEEYIKQQPKQAQPYLRQINETIQSALPDAIQKISWSMPTYWKRHNLIHFAASKNHVGLYPGRQPWNTLQTNCANTRQAKVRYSFRTANHFRHSLLRKLQSGAELR